MLTQHIALVSQHPALGTSQLAVVAAALQKQATRDLSPIWEVSSTVDAFPSLDDAPIGHWPVIITDRDLGQAGIHLDQDGRPYALVHFSPSWSLAASHECLEILVDASGNRTIASTSPDPDHSDDRVEVLLEVCDPCEDADFGYTIDGVLVSDFYTPDYLGPGGTGARYSFHRMLTKPREVLRNGYIAWRVPESGLWYQREFFAAAPAVREIGALSPTGMSLREAVDARTPDHRVGMTFDPQREVFKLARAKEHSARKASVARARRLNAHLEQKRNQNG